MFILLWADDTFETSAVWYEVSFTEKNPSTIFYTPSKFHLIRQAPKFKEFIQSMQSAFPVYLHKVFIHFTKYLTAGTMRDNLVRENCVGNLLFLTQIKRYLY